LYVPVAPASSKASACVNPNPRAAPDTKITLSVRLNSGSPFVVPRKAVAVSDLLSRGGCGGPRVAACIWKHADVLNALEAGYVILDDRRKDRQHE